MVLSAQSIRALASRGLLISPFHFQSVQNGMTFGLSPAGYDVRIDLCGASELLAGGVFRLASTVESFSMPDDVLGVVHDKSTWARRGLAVQNTVIEPGWRGFLTLELTNHKPCELLIRDKDPIAQVVFHWLDRPTERPYSGKYQDQSRGAQEALED